MKTLRLCAVILVMFWALPAFAQIDPELLKRAEQGNVNAQVQLGYIYSSGQGVAKDNVKAVQWLQKAAEQGDARAQFCLGLAYATGEGVPQDDTKATQWFQKAADQGEVNAQLKLMPSSRELATQPL